MRGSDKDIFRRDTCHFSAYSVSEDGRESQKICAYNRQPCIFVLENQGSNGELAFLSFSGFRGPDTAGDSQQRIRSHHADSDSRSKCRRIIAAKQKANNQE
jgi:hypothetical protein